MNQLFKAGDKVRCVAGSGVGFLGEIGQIYTVWRVGNRDDGYGLYTAAIDIDQDNALGQGLAPERFRLYDEKAESAKPVPIAEHCKGFSTEDLACLLRVRYRDELSEITRQLKALCSEEERLQKLLSALDLDKA